MVNWKRIVGVFFTTFCTVALAVDLFAPYVAIQVGLVSALLHAGVAVGAELQDEGKEEQKGTYSYTLDVLNKHLVF